MKNLKKFEEFYYSDTTNMTKELAKEMLEFLDKNGEYALVKEYKHRVSDNIISSIIGAWATSNKPLENILDEYWERHLKIYGIKEEYFKFKDDYEISAKKTIKHWNSLNSDERKKLYGHPESEMDYEREFSQQSDEAKVQIAIQYAHKNKQSK